MTYTVSADLVDLERVRAVYGSHNTALVDEIAAEYAQRLADYDEALEEIVAGTRLDPERGWQYGYALELLCMHFGQRLPSEPFAALRSSGIGAVTQLAGLEALNTGSRLPLPLPVPTDFPSITYLTWEEAAQTLARVQPIDLTGESAASAQDQTWAAEVGEQYRSWLRTAVRAQQGIIAFLY